MMNVANIRKSLVIFYHQKFFKGMLDYNSCYCIMNVTNIFHPS